MDRYVTISCLGSKGELGNQLFQIAATLGYAFSSQREFLLPYWFCNVSRVNYLNFFPSLQKYITANKQFEFNSKFLWSEPTFTYTPIPMVDDVCVDLDGYFQSEKYFKHIKSIIKDALTPEFVAKCPQWFYDSFSVNISQSTVLHIRTYSRGAIDPRSIHYSILDEPNYLKEAAKIVGHQTPIVVISDNISLCKKTLKADNLIFVEHTHPIQDLSLLICAKKCIISNSSFSWWGAYLGSDKRIIVAPRKWFNITNDWYNSADIHPSEWIVI